MSSQEQCPISPRCSSANCCGPQRCECQRYKAASCLRHRTGIRQPSRRRVAMQPQCDFPSVPSGNVLGPCSPKTRSLFTRLEKQSASSSIISRGPSNGREPHGLQTVANGSHSANKRATLHHSDLGTATSGPTSDGKPSQSSLVKTVPPHLSLPGVPMLVWQARTPLLCSNADASNATKTTKEMSPQG